MYFHTYTYALFLPLVLTLYFALPLRGRQYMLLVASYVFYCWELPIFGLLLLASTILDYVVCLALERTRSSLGRKAWLLVSLCGNLGMLGYFKYADFLGANLAGLGQLLGFDTHWAYRNLILPAGISFYTFQTLSYSISVYRRQMAAERDLLVFSLYVSFFPQLVAGPIERATNLLPQLKRHLTPTTEDVRHGLIRIVIGLFRKLVVADRLAILVNSVFADPNPYSTAALWMAAIAVTAQIYFDFAGYADIAIGTARLFGVRLMENFNHPLMASSPADFWNRWHISLTSWFRDYVFLPLGGFRKGGGRAALNATLVFLICGLWHGASWHFVAWGAYHAVLMCLYYAWKYRQKRMGRRSPSDDQVNLRLLLTVLGMFLLNVLGTVFFRATDLPHAMHVFSILFGARQGPSPACEWYVWGYAAIIALWFIIEFGQTYLGLSERYQRLPAPVRALGLAALIVLVVVTAVSSQPTYIYFQF